MAFPVLLFIIALASTVGDRLNNITFGFLGQGVFTLFLVFTIFGWFYPARIVRASVLGCARRSSSRPRAWSARATGGSSARTSCRTSSRRSIVVSTLSVAGYVLAEAGLSFLGVGIKLPTRAGATCSPIAPDFYTPRAAG